MERTTFDSQRTDLVLADSRRDNLYEPVADDGGERGRNWTGRTMQRSLYTTAVLNPNKAVAVGAATGLALFGSLRRLKHSLGDARNVSPPPPSPRP